MNVLRVKAGVEFTTIAPGGFRLLAALDRCTKDLAHDLTITSACDGEHSGPADPHHRGEAYDVRSHDLAPEIHPTVLDLVLTELGREHFFGFLEGEGTGHEHFHFQVKKGTTYP